MGCRKKTKSQAPKSSKLKKLLTKPKRKTKNKTLLTTRKKKVVRKNKKKVLKTET